MDRIVIIILIILFICALYLLYIQNVQIVEPFTRQFFTEIKPTHFIGIDQSQLFGNEFDLIEIISKMIPFNMNTLLIEQGMDRYKHLNNNHIQFILSRSNEIYNLLHKVPSVLTDTNIPNIRFVCTLFDVPLNILSTNMEINEVGDLKNSQLTVNIGPKNSIDYSIAMDLILQYNLTINKDIYLTYYDVNALLKHYGQDVQIAFITRTHPDRSVTALINHKLTKFVDILKYNDGNIYNLTLDEGIFYKTFPYFAKNIIEKGIIKNYYPNLVLNESVFNNKPNRPIESYRTRFINTVSVKYYLLSNTYTPNQAVYQLLYNMKLNMNEINQKEFVEPKLNTTSLTDFTMSLPIHQGASEFYYDTGLYTNISKQSCLMINGRCDEKQLSEHHL